MRSIISADEAVTRWLRHFEARAQEAARLMWQRYYRELVELVELARARLGQTPRRTADEEDVVQVRRTHRVRRGHYPGCGYDLTGNVSGACPECGTAAEGA